MDVQGLIVDDLDAESDQVVDHIYDGFLVAWDGMAGKQYAVARLEFEILIGLIGHPDQSAEFLSLGSRTEDHDAFVRQLLCIRTHRSDHMFRHPDIAKLLTELDIGDHGSSCEEDDPIVFDGCIDDLHQPSDIGSERREDDPRLAIPDKAVQVVSDDLLGDGMARSGCIGTLSKEYPDAFLADP